jgi:molybdopterin converting factor small subunit
MIKIKVRLFAAAAQMAGTSAVDLSLAADKSTVKDAIEDLQSRFAMIGSLIPISRWAVNGAFVELDCRLSDADVLAMIPPVSGG